MGIEYEEVYPIEAQKSESVCIESTQVFEIPSEPLYHYTSREVFWKILEDESFLARHILFSNDYEEYELGKKIVSKEFNLQGREDENEWYMICFCEQSDLLSQWRGYARDGIAMGFDFSYGLGRSKLSPYHCFTLVNNGTVPGREELDEGMHLEDKREEKFKERYLSADQETAEKKYLTQCITAPYKVFYIKDMEINSKLEEAINKIRALDDANETGIKLIPYIKNSKFDEEREYRLLFRLTDIYKPEYESLIKKKHTYLDVDGVKKPNIRVEFGNAAEILDENIVIYYKNEEYTKILESFSKEMTEGVNPFQIKLERVTNVLKPNEILLGNSRKQESIFWKLFQKLTNLSTVIDTLKDVRIWCDGHLPLRKVIVGPYKDAELMKKSIMQYKNNRYWMKYVDVELSKIPFRN